MHGRFTLFLRRPFTALLLATLVSALSASLAACGGSAGSGGNTNTHSTGSLGTTLPAPYGGMCSKYDLTCTATHNPPTLLGAYTGSGTTAESSSSTWTVGSTNTFSAAISSQTGTTIAGTFALGSLSLDITDGHINGDANAFTIYGTGSTTASDCTINAAVVIVGADASGTLTGELAILVTGTSGSGCASPDGGSSTPAANSGALFSFTGTKAANVDGG